MDFVVQRTAQVVLLQQGQVFHEGQNAAITRRQAVELPQLSCQANTCAGASAKAAHLPLRARAALWPYCGTSKLKVAVWRTSSYCLPFSFTLPLSTLAVTSIT